MPGLSQKYVGSILAFGSGGNINPSVTCYLAAPGGTANASEKAIIVTKDGRLKNLMWSAAASGLTGAAHTITVFVNGVATPLTSTWKTSALTERGTRVEVKVFSGDRISIRVVLAAGGTAIARLRASIELEMDSTSRWLTDDPIDPDANIYYPGNGNVGIGTTTPAGKLDVVGDLKVLLGPPINEFSTDVTFTDNSDAAVPTERAVREYIDEMLVGSISAFAMQTPPLGWKECNGQVLDRTVFPRLFNRIGITFGGAVTGSVVPVSAFAVIGADLFAGTNCGVYRSSDNGATWSSVNNGLPYSFVLSLAVMGADLFAGTDGGVYRSSDNGASWASVNNGLPSPVILSLAVIGTDLFAGTSLNASVAGGFSGVFRSSDSGVSWTQAGIFSADVVSLAVIGNDLFAGNKAGGVHRSSDNGASWAPANSGLTGYSIQCLAVMGADLFAGTIGCVLRSSDNGVTWVQVNSGLTIPFIRSLATSGTDLFAGTIVSSNTGFSGVFHSSDSGASWSQIGTFNTDVTSFIVKGTNLFAGTRDGVYRSPDMGASWLQVNNGLVDNGFKVPDLRGEFIRGWDGIRGVDTNRIFGSLQEHMLKNHRHESHGHGASNRGDWGGQDYMAEVGVPGETGYVREAPAGTETRPRNIALLYCIKV